MMASSLTESGQADQVSGEEGMSGEADGESGQAEATRAGGDVVDSKVCDSVINNNTMTSCDRHSGMQETKSPPGGVGGVSPHGMGPAQGESTPVVLRRKKKDSEEDNFEHSMSYEEDSLPGELLVEVEIKSGKMEFRLFRPS